MVIFSAVSGAMMLMPALTGCAFFIAAFNPCGNPLTGCALEEVVSLPPHDNPLSSSLAAPTPSKEVPEKLTKVVQAQYAAFERRWPQEPHCQEIAAVGCSYLITLQYTRARASLCEDFVYGVESGPRNQPIVRRKMPLLFTHYDCSKRTPGTPIGGVRS